jgi:hypothetical protein
VYLEVLAVDGHAFHEEAEDRLLGVEIGVVELGCQCIREGLDAVNSALREIALHAPGVEAREGELGRPTILFHSLHASAKHIEREGSGLIGIGEPITLPRQFLESGFSVLDSSGLVGRCRGRPFHPGRQLASEDLGVEKQIADGGPDRLVDASGPKPIVGTTAAAPFWERGGSPAADIVVVDVLPTGVAGAGLAASHIGPSAHAALQ